MQGLVHMTEFHTDYGMESPWILLGIRVPLFLNGNPIVILLCISDRFF